MLELYDKINEAVAAIKSQWNVTPKAGIILGIVNYALLLIGCCCFVLYYIFVVVIMGGAMMMEGM